MRVYCLWLHGYDEEEGERFRDLLGVFSELAFATQYINNDKHLAGYLGHSDKAHIVIRQMEVDKDVKKPVVIHGIETKPVDSRTIEEYAEGIF